MNAATKKVYWRQQFFKHREQGRTSSEKPPDFFMHSLSDNRMNVVQHGKQIRGMVLRLITVASQRKGKS